MGKLSLWLFLASKIADYGRIGWREFRLWYTQTIRWAKTALHERVTVFRWVVRAAYSKRGRLIYEVQSISVQIILHHTERLERWNIHPLMHSSYVFHFLEQSMKRLFEKPELLEVFFAVWDTFRSTICSSVRMASKLKAINAMQNITSKHRK